MTEIVQVKISEVKPNPFKKFINGGKLDKNRLAKMQESIEHGTLPNSFFARKYNGKWELAHGHHRMAAFKQKHGPNFVLNIYPVNYSDETMLVDMVRENLTHRDAAFQDAEDSVVLARAWLQSNAKVVKQFNNFQKKGNQGKRTDLGENHIDYRKIEKFLSKKAAALSYVTVGKYLRIHDNLHPDLHKKVENLEKKGGCHREGELGIALAENIAILPKSEQLGIYKQVKRLRLGRPDARKYIGRYRRADDLTKKRVREGKIDLKDLLEQTEEDSVVAERWDSGNKEAYKAQIEPGKFESEFNGKIEGLIESLHTLQLAAGTNVFDKKKLKQFQRRLKRLSEEMLEADATLNKKLVEVAR